MEIADDVLWSLEVKITGFNEFYEQDVALNCGVNEKDSILDIQVVSSAFMTSIRTGESKLEAPGTRDAYLNHFEYLLSYKYPF